MEERTKLLGEASIPRLLYKFSLPAIVGMLVNALYNVVDRIFVGRGVGSLAIAGTTVSFPVMLVIMAFSMLIGMGATSLISIRLGENKQAEAELIAGNAFVLLIIIAFSFSILSLLGIKPLLKLLGTSPEVMPYAYDYLSIILLGTILMAVSFGVNNFIRAEGNPKMAMVTMLIGAVSNIILDYSFIFIWGMGIKGAAWATIISQGISTVWVLNYFLSGKSLLKIRVNNFKLQLKIVKKIMALGFPPFAMQLVNSVQQTILVNSLNYYGGDLAISAMGIIFSVSTLLFMPVIGITQGAQPIIGYNYGARKTTRVKDTLKYAFMAATAILLLGYLVIWVFPQQLIALFSQDDIYLISLGAHGLKTFLFALPVVGLQVVASNYFQATGKPRQATLLTLSRQLLIFIPLLLILPRFWGLNGIWWSAPIADVASTLLSTAFLFYELKRMNSLEMGHGDR